MKKWKKYVLLSIFIVLYICLELVNLAGLELEFRYTFQHSSKIIYDINIFSPAFSLIAFLIQLHIKKNKVAWLVLSINIIAACLTYAVIIYESWKLSLVVYPLLSDKVLPVTSSYIFPVLGVLVCGLIRQIKYCRGTPKSLQQ